MTTALTKANDLTAEEITEMLQASGWAEKSQGVSLPRMKMEGNILSTPDGQMFVYNPAKPKVPAAQFRIVKPPVEYWGIWITPEMAAEINHPELANSFSKKYLDADANNKIWPADAAFESLKAAGYTAAWKGDMQVQIIPADGQMTGEEQIYILTLATTSLIEFKGASRAPEAGSVSEFNFIQKLVRFAAAHAPEGVSNKKAMLDALTALSEGGVVAEVRILRATNTDKSRSWSVVSFDPIFVLPPEEHTLLESGEDPTL